MRKLPVKSGSKWENKGGNFQRVTYYYDVSDKTIITNSKDLFDILLKVNNEGKSPVSFNGLKLFLYVLLRLKRENEILEIKDLKVLQEIGMPVSSYYQAKKELVDFGLLIHEKGKDRGNLMYVNTDFIFRGNKMKYYERYYPTCLKYI